jgi:FtsP/CotA-like multicopper oxidase with cupredoxin domain
MSALEKFSRLSVLAGIVLAGAAINPGHAAELAEPPVLASANHALNLLMVARPERVTLEPFRPTAWVYDICPRPPHGDNTCPPSKANRYGGTRLQLEQGDTLKIRLVNKLPYALDSKHQLDNGGQYLWLNPTNLHTHGMLVSSHFPTMANPTYGDNVFVLTFNPDNGPPPAGSHLHGDVRYGHTDYEIRIPPHHPSGLYWFHPHAHGLSLNQISAGMAGIITIGQPSDYIGCSTGCGLPASDIPLRHMILKDTQVLPPNALLDQQDPAFCDFSPGPQDPPRQGFCLHAGGEGTGTDRGRWFFTVNGRQYPHVTVASPAGQIWRITNASASVTYNLELADPIQNRNMLMQVVSIDGVSVRPDRADSTATLTQAAGKKFDAVTCPKFGNGPEPLCVRRLVMFPSSRVELWVTYRDANDKPASPPKGAKSVLRDRGMNTGPGGDAWPAVDLASVSFTSSGPEAAMAPILDVEGDAHALMKPMQLAAELAADSKAFVAESDCKPLAKDHSRRIFFNSIPSNAPPPGRAFDEEGDESPFGLGYEELDERGKPVPGTFVDVSVFNPDKPTICLTLGPGNSPANERWELVNLASEDHNFHMHQTKFSLLTEDEVAGTTVPTGHGILHDNVPVRHADGTCLTVKDWRKGRCTAHPVSVEIPFTVAGDYVYHCHILEHEDGGMMARIRVRSSKQ